MKSESVKANGWGIKKFEYWMRSDPALFERLDWRGVDQSIIDKLIVSCIYGQAKKLEEDKPRRPNAYYSDQKCRDHKTKVHSIQKKIKASGTCSHSSKWLACVFRKNACPTTIYVSRENKQCWVASDLRGIHHISFIFQHDVSISQSSTGTFSSALKLIWEIQLNARSKQVKSPITLHQYWLKSFKPSNNPSTIPNGYDGSWVWWSAAMKVAWQRSALHRAKASGS
jgi:hypothetical protein